MEEKEISLNLNFFAFFFHHLLVFVLFNFVFILCVLHLFYSRLCYICIYIHAHIHSLSHTHMVNTHRHIHTQPNTFHVNSRHEQHSLLHSFAALSLSLSFTHSLSLSRRSHPRILCCVLHQLPFCLIFNFSVRLNLHAWLLYVKSRTGAL